MDKNPNVDASGTRVNELLSFQKDLIQEKEVLTKLLSKIDEQINALQVEQLHLMHTMNAAANLKAPAPTDTEKPRDLKNITLDLSVPAFNLYFSEEEDDEEEEDD